MPLPIHAGQRGLHFVTIACPTWDGACHCEHAVDGSVPQHHERHWLTGFPGDTRSIAEQEASAVEEARLLAAEHYARAQARPYGALDGLSTQ